MILESLSLEQILKNSLLHFKFPFKFPFTSPIISDIKLDIIYKPVNWSAW